MLLHIVALLLSRCLVKADTCETSQKVGFILPGNVIPTDYYLRLLFMDNCGGQEEFNFNEQYTGVVIMTVEAVKPGVKVIEMNALDLYINKASVLSENGTTLATLKPVYYKREEKVLFKLPFELPVFKPTVLNVKFLGRFVRPRYGMFKGIEMISVGDPEKIIKREVIGTILEPASARQVYPCFDEPAYKATFTVSFDTSECILDKGYLAFSNTPVERIERRKGRAIIHFEKTNAAMSTYLMTIALAPFVSVKTQQFNSSYPDAGKTEWKNLTTWGTKDFIQSKAGPLAQKAGIRIMEIFTNDFRMGYPLTKLDQLNFNTHIISGGMENWGAVLYGMGHSELDDVALIAHELAHQWFGNLVTCHWWSDLWLNEGFATYFSVYGSHKFALEYPVAEGWIPLRRGIAILRSSLRYDVLEKRPLISHFEDPRIYKHVFDMISYDKGGSIIRMWNHTLGEEAFLKAIHKYLDERKLDVATSKHLLQAFDSVANESSSNFGKDLPSKYFEKWTTQSGYPLVTVTKSQINPFEYILTQTIFRPGPHQLPTKWTIPISYSTNCNMDFNKTHAMIWFNEDDETAVIRLTNDVQWIIVNNMFTGYYRVNYDQDNWQTLIGLLLGPETRDTIPAENRIQIISDLAAIAADGSSAVDYDFVMNLTLYLKHETDYYPWKAALDDVLNFLDVMLSKSEAFYGLFKDYVMDLLQENYSRLSYTKKAIDTYSDKELRLETVKWACRMNHSGCITDSRNFLKTYTRRGNMYNEPYEEHELYETAYCTNIRYSDNDWDTLWRKYLSAENFVDKKTILNGISCSNDENIIRSLLMMSVDEKKSFSDLERRSILESVMKNNPSHIGMAFDFFTARYSSINKLYSGTRPVAELLFEFADKLGTNEELDQMKDFLAVVEGDEDIRLTSKDIQRILAVTESNNEWMRNKVNEVILWLFEHYENPILYK